MVQMIRWTAPMFLFLGTVGLLLNEFIFAWGRPATIAFAALNIIGLAILVILFTLRRKIEEGDSS
jgi:hypothetical protein